MVTSQSFDADAALDTIRRIASNHGVRSSKVTPSARLLEDWRMDGDDAIEFLEQVSEALGINMSAFDAAGYVGPEGFDPIGISRLWTGKARKLRPLTIGRLIEAARIGRWVPDA